MARALAPLLLPFLLIAVTVAGCTTKPGHGLPAVRDIHGIAVDPSVPNRVYVATHYGLFRVDNDTTWTTITKEGFDMMGFAVHPRDPRIMYASGHPATPTEADWSVGVVKSTDGGATWTTMALKNEVDFHALAVSLADPQRIWGYHLGKIYQSDDAGAHWTSTKLENVPSMTSFASSATDPDLLFAGTSEGILQSKDAGKTWHPLRGSFGSVTAVATTIGNTSVIVAYAPLAGGFIRSTDGGANWTAFGTTGRRADSVSALAIDPRTPETIYFGTFRGALLKTTDAGVHWILVRDVDESTQSL